MYYVVMNYHDWFCVCVCDTVCMHACIRACVHPTGEDILLAVSDIMEDLQGLPVYVQGLTPGQVPTGMQSFDELMMNALPVAPDRSIREGMTATSIMSYIYTSGTTGETRLYCFWKCWLG